MDTPTRRWYYIKDKQRIGPIADDEFRDLFKNAVLSSDTFVWTKGLEKWTRARLIKNLIPQECIPPPLPPDLSQITSAFNPFPEVPQIRPWVRYYARMIDFYIANAVVICTILLLGYHIKENAFFVAITIISGFIWVFIEPLFLSRFGATPGKMLLKTKVVCENGNLLSYEKALDRSFTVLINGEAFYIPIAIAVNNYVSYRQLIKKGKTSWDRTGGFRVEHKKIGVLRVIAAFILITGISFFLNVIYNWTSTPAERIF